MVLIRNKLNQRFIINLIGGKKVDLLAKGTMNLPEKDLSSPHLQALLVKGDILALQSNTPAQQRKDKDSKKGGSKIKNTAKKEDQS